MRLRSLAIAALLGAATTLPAQQPAASTPGVALQPGDMLRIKVWENADLSGDFEVAPDGSLRHPIYNRIRVSGVPVAELRPRIEEFLRSFQREPLVEVEPLLRITVGGEVRTPNIYMFGPEITVAEAIARAGGATSDGRMSSITLERAGQRRTLDLSDPAAQLESETIRSGDRITVGRGRRLLRDVVGPAASVAGTLVSLIILIRR